MDFDSSASFRVGHRARRSSAFTLTELMIAIALSLLLILAINTVFKLSSDAVGNGFQLSSMNRQFRFMGDTMNTDTLNMADYQTQPALIIQCMNTPAFRDKTDMASEPNFKTGTTTDPTGQTFPTGMMQITGPTGAPLYPLPGTTYTTWQTAGIANNTNLYKVRYEICDDRNHRTDIFSFFANNDTFRRQTGAAASGTALQSDFTSQEAYIWYGHVILPNNFAGTAANPASQAFYVPVSQNPYSPSTFQYALGIDPSTSISNSITTVNNDPSNNGNPNNFFASQWAVGRMAVLMTAPPTSPPPPAALPYTSPYTKLSQPQNYLYTPAGTAAYYLKPLGYTTQTNDTPTLGLPTVPFIYNSLSDLAGATLSTFRSTVLAAEYPGGANTAAADDWYLPLISQFTGTSGTAYNSDQTFRFWAKPWPNKSVAYGQQNTTGLITQEIARTIPVFTRGCSQFIVEYAGDYLKQDLDKYDASGNLIKALTGNASDVGEDGQLDYDVILNPVTSQTYKRIRWYGLTRSLDGGVTVEDASQTIANPPANTEIVRPLWRYIQSIQATQSTSLPATSSFNHLPFEKVGSLGQPAPNTPHDSSTGGAGFPSGSYPASVASTSYQTGYTCAWAPDDIDLDNSQRPAGDAYHAVLGKNSAGKYYFPSRSMLPWLIRVTVRLDDPNGRVPQGQTMQFIFKVNRPH